MPYLTVFGETMARVETAVARNPLALDGEAEFDSMSARNKIG
jgi:hypothetical protein